MIKLLADENVHYDIVKYLIAQNYDISFVPHIGLAGASDDNFRIFNKK